MEERGGCESPDRGSQAALLLEVHEQDRLLHNFHGSAFASLRAILSRNPEAWVGAWHGGIAQVEMELLRRRQLGHISKDSHEALAFDVSR